MKPIRLPKILAFLLPAVVAVTGCPGDDTSGQDTTTANEPTSTGPDGTTAGTAGTVDPDTAGTAETVDPDTAGTADTAGETEPAGGACDRYCTNALANCTGDNALYTSMDECLATCAAMPEGDPADTAGNTAYCRAYHAGDPAIMDPAMHCPHASASGGTVCGTPCEAYCSQMGFNCGGEVAVFPSEDDCMAACAAFPDDGAFNAIDGNSVQCRIYHASFPAAQDAMTHCGHASPNGGETCGTLCDAYCDQVLTNCAELYANEDECMTSCEAFPTNGDYYAQAGDNVQCRIYHASFPAAADAATHCPHADVDGGGVCVDA